MAGNRAHHSDPELQTIFERWERREQLTPFWDDAEKDALKELPPPPEIPNPRDFGLTEARAQKLPGSSIATFANGFLIVFIGIGLWAGFQLIENFDAADGLAETNKANINVAFFLFALALVSIYGWLLHSVEKYLQWVENSWWDKLYPGWRSYLDKKNNFEKEKNEYNRKKYELIRANAERRHAIALRKEDYWRKLSGLAFETELANLYKRMGYDVEKTPYTNDGGVDLILRKSDRLTVVQCKAHQTRVSISTARELYASMIDFKADAAIIACFEGVTKPVEEYAKSRSINILNVNDIVLLHERYGMR